MTRLDGGAGTLVRRRADPPLWEAGDLTIRRYRSADHAVVLSMHREGLAQVGLRPGDGVYYDHDFFRMEEIYLHNGGEFVVGEVCREHGCKPVAMGGLRRADVVPCGVERAHGGYVAAAPVSDTAEMVRLRVLPSEQRRGYGSAIVAALEERAAELGYRMLHCDTTALQGPAMDLYRGFGWRETEREVIGGIVNVYFEKSLR